ncbi:MAG: energy-coupling factor transporter ATPase [Clostridia bacterium]|nr:energy-coupling factor transporter ATPase [Clostridia bacterium]
MCVRLKGEQPVIEVKKASFSYDDEETKSKRIVIDNVDLAVNDGEFVAILGHNGSGKSSLVKLFNCVNIPCGGKVYVDGLDTSDYALLLEIRRRVGMVFQNPDNQLVATIVEEDVAFGPENLGVPSLEIRERVDNALKAVGMYEFLDSAPHNLSGGQKQRIAIAGVLAMNPETLILDESTAMLDPMGRREVMETIKRLNKGGMTVILITHYMEEAAEAGRVIVMEEGKVWMDSTPEKVFAKVEEMKALRLGVPQASELAYLLRKGGFNLPDTILTPKDFVESFLKEVKTDD